MIVSLRRAPLRAVTAFAAVAVLLSVATPAPAAPQQATDSEGGSAALNAALASASRGYTDAHTKLVASRARQVRLTGEQQVIERQVSGLSQEVNRLASDVYQGGNPDSMLTMTDAASMDEYVERATLVGHLSSRNSDRLAALRSAKEKLKRQQDQVAAEVRSQATLEQTMTKRRNDALRALGLPEGFGGSARSSRAAPRAKGGKFAAGCTIDDPTTSSGCLTARTLNAYQQARQVGFTRFTSCFRQASFGEHPDGKACDFSVTRSGFGGVASGDAKTYGNELADYFIQNSEVLGVLYVIWFKRIWLPGVGWEAYNRGQGDPSSDHTNHVHLSVR